MSQPHPAAPRGHPLLSAPCPVPLLYSQSVKKTWAALYLEVGGSLKSLMREWMDCKRHASGWAGQGGPASRHQNPKEQHPVAPTLHPTGLAPQPVPGCPHGRRSSSSSCPQPLLTFSEGVMRYTASRLGSGSRRLLMSSTTGGGGKHRGHAGGVAPAASPPVPQTSPWPLAPTHVAVGAVPSPPQPCVTLWEALGCLERSRGGGRWICVRAAVLWLLWSILVSLGCGGDTLG